MTDSQILILGVAAGLVLALVTIYSFDLRDSALIVLVLLTIGGIGLAFSFAKILAKRN